MTQFLQSLLKASLLPLLIGITMGKANIAGNRCKSSSSNYGSCQQVCKEDCKMTCRKNKPPLKSCDQACFNDRCDIRCFTNEMCYQTCESQSTCTGSMFCKTANCTQDCPAGNCDLSCRASFGCKQFCNEGSCNLKCPKTGEHCKQVSLSVTSSSQTRVVLN